MKNIHLMFKFLWYSVLVCIWGVSCTSSGTYKKTQMDIYMQYYDFIIDSLSENPSYVCARTARQMAVTTDSVAYYHYLVLLAKAYMFKSEMDSARLSMNRAEVFCDGAVPSSLINDLYADIYNMRGNVCARQGLADSSVICFQKAFDYRLQGSNRDVLPDISINLADAFVRTGHYDKGAMWYRKSLSYSDSLKIPEEKRFPAYYGLAQVYMELRDFTSCDYYYELAARHYDKMLPFEKHIYLNNRGNSYYFRADYPKALEIFRRSLVLARSYPDMIFEEHLTEMNLGETFLLMNQVDSAAYYLNLCGDFFRSIENQTALYYLDTQLIELALKQNDLPLARKRMSEAVQPDYVEPNMQHIRNRYLQHYFEEAGDFRQAYYYQMENQRIDDSTRNERIKMRTAEIDLKYSQDTTLMKQKIFIQQKETEVLALNQTLYIWISVCICVLFLVVFIIVYNKKRHYLLQMRTRTMITALRMENIRNRISPHFIFNILNREMGSYTDEQAENMRGLVKLMRRNLELTGQFCVTIAEELDFVNTFINLERKALGDNFILSIFIDEAINPDQEILPSMMIQIPVENALKHALKDKEGMKRLWIDIRRIEIGICIKIRDNGGGYKVNSVNHGTGTGMKVIFQTVQLLNANNKKHLDISIANVQLDEGEIGCEFTVILPQGYDYNLKKMV
ncbi:histidine kinase [Bacteroides sartorii]|uniref:tetratricopeptide repeat-containing sensor histidine kinase n=1 Tax=Phocaeicola sartorii TaxID=671267 RepID=UPI0015855704|nr:histidine kinase [Phocaeicola sartorii]NUK99944.1 histidine kinase [Phocaeicola sartorii]